ncbi:hypothetical protein V1498_07825 [Peribacillus sp. SCS-26]|uniref:hypothetical protein n=1 Tax=Paraperibacillus marinus TaxID=3115295 RepID=UPI0039065247
MIRAAITKKYSIITPYHPVCLFLLLSEKSIEIIPYKKEKPKRRTAAAVSMTSKIASDGREEQLNRSPGISLFPLFLLAAVKAMASRSMAACIKKAAMKAMPAAKNCRGSSIIPDRNSSKINGSGIENHVMYK